jgi:thioredoxin-related protein
MLFAVPGAFAQAGAPSADRPTWISFNDALQAAEANGKMVVIDVWSKRCGWCRKMQEEVYTESGLLSYLNEKFETGRLDIDARTDTVSYMGYELSSAELSQGLGATGTPTTVFLTSDGSYITRLPGFHAVDEYMRVLKFIGDGAYRDMSFQEYVATLSDS